jgi:hypothetical protein
MNVILAILSLSFGAVVAMKSSSSSSFFYFLFFIFYFLFFIFFNCRRHLSLSALWSQSPLSSPVSSSYS